MSAIQYPGWFDNPINKEQFSSLIAFYMQPKKMPFEITCGTAVDFGNALPKNFVEFLIVRFLFNE